MVKKIQIKKEKKAQIWSLDMIIAVVMFTLALFAVYEYLINAENKKIGDINELTRDSQIVSDLLLSTGNPESWTVDDVKEIGITSNNRIDIDKWERFSQIEYYKTKRIFNTKYDYYVYFVNQENSVVSINGIQGVGNPGVTPANIDSIETNRIVRVDRLVIYESRIVKMVLLVWE